MTNLLFYNYFYRYRAFRKKIKGILDIDTIEAKNMLDQIIIEHDVLNDPEESSHLHHAQDHLNAFQHDTNQEIQKDATINALDE